MTSDGDGLRTSDGPLVEVHDAVFLDLDGVVYIGPDALPGVVDTVNRVDLPVAYLTNNATRAATEIADHLRSFGLRLDDDAVVTAGQVVSDRIAVDLGTGARVLVAGADGMRRAVEEAGLVAVTSMDDDPEAVVQGGVVDIRWSQLAEASYAVAAGLPWYASNPDLTFPTPRGLAPGNGALVQAVRTATGAEPLVAGKPGRLIFDTASRRLGAQRPIMVGDRVDTDIDGAITAGVPSMLVLTGVTDLAHLFAVEPGHRPDFVSATLAGLNAEHPAVSVTGHSARCRGVTAEARDGVIEVDGAPRDICSIRAATALAWSMRDASDVIARPGGTLEP